MDKNTQQFITLYKYFDKIQSFQRGSGVNVDGLARQFYVEFLDVTLRASRFEYVLKGDEWRKVQFMVNRITGNRNVSRNIRMKILEQSLTFNEIVEAITKTIVQESINK